MDLKRIKHFVAVVDHGSFRKAAETMHISQPALSISIKKLEQSLNCELLDRAAGKVVPTAFGRSLSQSARTIQKELKLAQDRLNEIHGITKGHVAIGISPYAFSSEQGRLIGEFVNQYPGLELRITIETYESALPLLANEEIDFFIAEVADRSKHPRIGYRTLYRNPYVIVARPDHPLAARKKLSVKDIAGCRWIYGSDLIKQVKNWRAMFLDAGLTPPAPVIAGGNIEFYESLMACSDFLAALPLAYIRERISSGSLVSLEIAGEEWFNYMDIVYRNDLTLSPGARRLFDEVIATITNPSISP
jgi:DNA-binding transcriptional LysR family regulator